MITSFSIILNCLFDIFFDFTIPPPLYYVRNYQTFYQTLIMKKLGREKEIKHSAIHYSQRLVHLKGRILKVVNIISIRIAMT